jgi:hypothetical protein
LKRNLLQEHLHLLVLSWLGIKSYGDFLIIINTTGVMEAPEVGYISRSLTHINELSVFIIINKFDHGEKYGLFL